MWVGVGQHKAVEVSVGRCWLVKDLDRFELGLQAVEYERRWWIDDLQGFWEGSVPHIGHPRIRRWAEELVKEREGLWRSRGREEYVQELPNESAAETEDK